jgi:hypothetical protein
MTRILKRLPLIAAAGGAIWAVVTLVRRGWPSPFLETVFGIAMAGFLAWFFVMLAVTFVNAVWHDLLVRRYTLTVKVTPYLGRTPMVTQDLEGRSHLTEGGPFVEISARRGSHPRGRLVIELPSSHGLPVAREFLANVLKGHLADVEGSWR